VIILRREKEHCAIFICTQWWLQTSSKLTGKKSKKQPDNSDIDNFSKLR